MKTTENELKQIFHPIEHAIISQWLGKEPPQFCKGVDIHTREENLPDGVIQLEPDMDGEVGTYEISNAVARIVLSTVQHKLPQWVAIASDKTVFGRYPFEKHNGNVSLLPQFLLEINWADSGPGYSWPVAYYVGYLPYYDLYVVTGSADSPDVFGYNDVCLGYFSTDEDILTGSARIIGEEWKRQHDEWNQNRWEELWRTGLLSAEVINEIADSIWEQSEQEEALS